MEIDTAYMDQEIAQKIYRISDQERTILKQYFNEPLFNLLEFALKKAEQS